jgi:hypothetical protein
MPIEGDLKSINFAGILQLVAQEHLTGVLKIKRKSDVVDIGFLDGLITGAFFERGDRSDRLENYLVRSGFIKKNLYEMVEEIHQETKRPIMNIIIEDKYLTVQEIERIIKFKIQEVLDEVFTWQEGEFKFEQGSVIYPKSVIKVRLSTDSLVLEAARRFDEWPRIAKQIPSGDLVYKKIERPELKLKLPEDEDRVLTLLDGHRSVDELVGISGLGKFHTYSCLFHLITTGQVDLSYAKPVAKQVKPKRKISLKFMTVPLMTVVIIGVILFEFLAGNYLSRLFNFPVIATGAEECIQSWHDYQKTFFYRHNRMPSPNEVKAIFEL